MPNLPSIDLGIPEAERKAIAKGLGKFLADTYTLYLKTHNYHWNVTGPLFQTLHLMFEEQYNELWVAVDVVAERIRALGEYAPGTYREFADRTELAEADGVPRAQAMIRDLVKGHETVARSARSLFPMAEKGNDEATLDLLTQRIQIHEKTAWMLRSLIEENA